MAIESQFKTVGAAEEKRRAVVLVRDLGMSASSSQQISVNGVACMTPMRRADAQLIDPVCFVAQGGDLERHSISDGKPVQIKETNDVLQTCGYAADDQSMLVLDSLQLIERLLSGAM